jgi:hypothetical protein
LPIWELESVFYYSNEEVKSLLRIPYSSTPPIGDYYGGVMLLDADEWKMFRTRFGGLATLPPDWRLNLDFQNRFHRGPIKSATLESVERRYNALHAIGGSLQVQDICRERNHITALDVEALMAFPATTIKVTRGWKLNFKSAFNALHWNRIM